MISRFSFLLRKTRPLTERPKSFRKTLRIAGESEVAFEEEMAPLQ